LKPADREWIEELLADPSRSYRSISRETGYSDWTIRRVQRELDGDTRPMKQPRYWPEEPGDDASPLISWLVFGGFAILLTLAIWARTRWAPPPDL
jgi:hypothetical protein